MTQKNLYGGRELDLKKHDLHIPISDSHLIRIQQLCLCMVALAELLFFAFGALFSLRIVFYRLVSLASTVLFCLASFLQLCRAKAPYPFRLSLLMAFWYMILCSLHRTDLSFAGDSPGLFLCVYLMALPFARCTQDEDSQSGLKIMEVLFISVSLIWVLYGLLLMLNCLPVPLQRCVAWDGARLQATLHPNVCARVFFVGIAFCLCLYFQANTRWMRILSLFSAVLIYAALSLTNSRSAIFSVCILMAGTVFFLLRRGSQQRLLLRSIAALGVFCLLFLIYQGLFSWNAERLLRQSAVLESSSAAVESAGGKTSHSETDLQKTSHAAKTNSASHPHVPSETAPIYNPQGSFLDDLSTLNNRTMIWYTALEGIGEQPIILLFGTDHPGALVEKLGVEHSHNAWLEVLLRLGLPGFLMSLVFTVQAFQSAFRLLYHQTELQKKILAMLVLCLLLCSTVEPSLFFSSVTWHFQNFLFFLLLGYLRLWEKQISPALEP